MINAAIVIENGAIQVYLPRGGFNWRHCRRATGKAQARPNPANRDLRAALNSRATLLFLAVLFR